MASFPVNPGASSQEIQRRMQMEARNNGLGLLAILPHDVLTHIAEYLSPYERLGLGTVSNAFRDVILHHYDRFTPDAWRIGVASGSQVANASALRDLANRAFAQIVRRVPIALDRKPNEGVCCSALVQMSQGHMTPTGETVMKVNCLGELIVDGRTVRALNFVGYSNQEQTKTLAKALGVDLDEFRYQLVQQHHVELRFLLRLARAVNAQEARLNIDKLCCLFCAIQLHALGYGYLISGWHARALSWYTFSPLVMYFRDKRRMLWGSEIEAAFNNLSASEKLYVLKSIVELTQNESATLSLVPAAYRPPKCRVPGCPGYLSLSPWNRWKCSEWKNHCSGEPPCPSCKRGCLRLQEPSGVQWKCYYCHSDFTWGVSVPPPAFPSLPARSSTPPKRESPGASPSAKKAPPPFPFSPPSQLAIGPPLPQPFSFGSSSNIGSSPGPLVASNLMSVSAGPPILKPSPTTQPPPKRTKLACPKCGADMVFVSSGKPPFWGCSRYRSHGCTGKRSA